MDSLLESWFSISMLIAQVLSDQGIEKIEKIERLEAILSAATAATASGPASMTMSSGSYSLCTCDCHNYRHCEPSARRSVGDVSCQTLSTGDIVITTVYFPTETDSSFTETCLTPSPKKHA